MPKSYGNVNAYFSEIKNGLTQIHAIIASSRLTYEERTPTEGIVFVVLYFIDSSELHIREYIIIDQGILNIVTYRLHWQDIQKELISRWDNAPHHRNIKTFPDHKHTKTSILDSSPQNILSVLMEIENSILAQKP